MSAGLSLILIVGVAYLAAHVAFDWIARRFLIVSGAEYLLLGILLGPQVSNVFPAGLIADFSPLTTLALGWIGAIVGMQFHLPDLIRIRGEMYRLAFFEALITLAFVAAVEMLALAWLFNLTWAEAALPAVALGAIATASAPAAIEVVARRLGRRGTAVRQLQVATAIDALVAILAIGLVVAITHPVTTDAAWPRTPTEWVVLTLGIGVVGGALFHLFLGSEHDVDRLFIAMAGAIILASGAAAYLDLSPLLPAMIIGMILANTGRNREELERTLLNAERPFYFVLLIFAGASWQPSLKAWWLAPVVLFLAARMAGKIGGARLGARVNGVLDVMGPHWGRALLGQGGLALALGLDYLQQDTAVLGNIVFTAVIVSVLFTDLTSAYLVQSVVAPLEEPARVREGTPPAGTPALEVRPPDGKGDVVPGPVPPGATGPGEADTDADEPGGVQPTSTPER